MGLKLKKIHEDERGEIYIIVGDSLKEHEEITIFTTKRNYARGGCIHKKHSERFCILEGIIEYDIGGCISIYGKGSSFIIPRNIPHYFKSMTDSIVMEWGASSDEKKKKHRKYRKIVDKINAKV